MAAPRSRTPPLLALHRSRALQWALQAVFSRGMASRVIGPALFAPSWSELERLCRSNPGSPAIVDPFYRNLPSDPPPASPPGLLLAPLASNPLICSPRAGHPGPAWLGTVESNFTSALPDKAEEDFDVLASTVLRAIEPDRPGRLIDHIEACADPQAYRIARQALDRSWTACTVTELAASVGLPYWTLVRRCNALRLPNPKHLLSLARAYTVERLAEWSGRPSGAVAVALHFFSGPAYRRMVRGAMGFPPTVVREKGGADFVGRTIVAAVLGSHARSSRAGWEPPDPVDLGP